MTTRTIIRETTTMRAEMDDRTVWITILATGRVETMERRGMYAPAPVTVPATLAALRGRNLDPASRRMMGLVAMPTEDAEAIYAAAHTTHVTTPGETRQALRDRVTAIVEEMHETADAAISHAGEHGTYIPPADLTADLAAAKKALADFDAAHPDVLADISGTEADYTVTAPRGA